MSIKLILILSFLISPIAFADYGLNMTEGVSSISRDIYDLHMLIFWICVVIGIAVFGVMFYSIINHRQSKGAKPANFHESTLVEILWTAIPILILVLMAIPATKTLIDLETTDKSDMTVKITGYQWKWQYEYPQEKISFFSNLAQKSRDNIYTNNLHKNYLLDVDKPMVLPVGKKIRFLMTSSDVIHSWWVPEFGVKQDAIPGFINDSWVTIDKPGTYRGQCAELCGKDHGFMPIVVEAKSQVDYARWVNQQKQLANAEKAGANKTWAKADLMKKGEVVYNSNCASCHQKNGAGIPPVFPAMKNSKIANGSASDHIKIVLHGKGAMPPFKGLSDTDLAAVMTYERNGFGNGGSVIQPSSVKNAR